MIKLSHAWGSECNALIGTFGMHAFTYCDTITAFAGPGQTTAFGMYRSLTRPIKKPSLNQDVYGKYLKSPLKKLQESTHTTSSQINFHLVRTVSLGYHRAEMFEPSFVPSPTDCGWTTDEDRNLAVEWVHGSPEPDTVQQLLSCKCVRSCILPVCTCLSNCLKSTDM